MSEKTDSQKIEVARIVSLLEDCANAVGAAAVHIGDRFDIDPCADRKTAALKTAKASLRCLREALEDCRAAVPDHSAQQILNEALGRLDPIELCLVNL